MSFRLVLKSVTLNDLERRNGSYFALFNRIFKPAFQLITASSSIELIDQKSAPVTHRAMKLVCISNSRIYRWSEFHRYLLAIYRLSFALPL